MNLGRNYTLFYLIPNKSFLKPQFCRIAAVKQEAFYFYFFFECVEVPQCASVVCPSIVCVCVCVMRNVGTRFYVPLCIYEMNNPCFHLIQGPY